MLEETKDLTVTPDDQAESGDSDPNASDNQDFAVRDAVVKVVVPEEGAGDGNEVIDRSPATRPTEVKNRRRWRSLPKHLSRRRHVRRTANNNRRWQALCRCLSLHKEPTTNDDDQVRIPPREELGLKGLAHASGEAISAASNWLQRRTFVAVVGLFLVFYLAAIILFCCILTLAINLSYSERGMMCCIGYDFDDNTISNNYVIVFELSWTTFATVGYGDVAVPADEECQGVRYMLAIEAFLGILFTSVCGAIFYSKIVRLHTQAHVTFSSAICLHYGSGITDPVFDVVRSGKPKEHLSCLDKDAVTNFPIIELRCLNDRATAGGGEIIGASLKCSVNSLEEVRESEQDGDRSGDVLRGSPSNDDSHVVMKRLITSNLSLSPDTHPYLSSGIWFIRHVLDHESPLLTASVKERIAALGGWPADLDSPAKIRGSLNQNVRDIIITFTGTSNLTADRVFLNQRYTLSDIYIGWKFASMVYIVAGGSKKQARADLDMTLVHDITPVLGEEHESLDSPELSIAVQRPHAYVVGSASNDDR